MENIKIMKSIISSVVCFTFQKHYLFIIINKMSLVLSHVKTIKNKTLNNLMAGFYIHKYWT